MNVVLVLSIAVRVLATAWSVVLLRRLRDWRMGLLTAMLALMTTRQLLTLVNHLRWPEEAAVAHPFPLDELPGAAVSLLAVIFVVLLDRTISAQRAAAEQRRRDEETLRASEARLRVMLEQLPAVVWTTDRELRFTSSRGAGLASLGLEADEVVGTSLEDFFQIRDPEFPALASHRRALEGEWTSYEMEWGDQAYQTSVEPLRDERGAIVGVVGVALDVTEARESLAALQASEEKFRQLFEDSQDVIFISTPEGRLVDINPAGVELFGYDTKEELLAIDIEKELYLDSFQRHHAMELLSRQGMIKDFEISLRRRDGARLTALETTTSVRDADGRVVAYRGILRDVSQQRLLEQQLRQSQRMEAVGRLAGGIAHDFNNLLTVIIGRADLLESQLEAGSPLLAEVQEVKSAGERAAALTRQLLILSRHQVVAATVVDLNRVIADVEGLVRRSIGEHIELVVRPADDLRCVRADPGQLEQVLLNLTLNARDAMPRGGRLTIDTVNFDVGEGSTLERSGLAPGPYVRLRVADTGTGIAPEIREHIFEPFFSTKDPSRGTGLGLATVYGIVEQSRGRIVVESEPGQGALFEIFLPAVSEPAEVAERPAAGEEAPGGRETILLVEDEESVRKLMHSFLVSRGYRVLVAADGRRALEEAAEGDLAIDLLLTDMVMPGISGVELARRLRATRPDLKVLFISGYRERLDEASREQRLHPEENFLQKPFSTDHLARRLRSILDG